MIFIFNSKQKTLRLFFLACILLISASQTCEANTRKGQDGDQAVEAIENLVKRLMPRYADRFTFITLDAGKDIFELEAVNGKVVIRGNTSNSMAVGLNHYLKYYCHSSVSWYRADSLYLPKTLPLPDKKIIKTARSENRFFLNYCTFGYTMPWWQWKDWEWFIDWMALNGITMPLAITGQEAVWYQVWKKFGLSDEEIRTYFTGPAYLPWHRMANIDKWDGPLPLSWINQQSELQKKIVSRERELGMKPVLPAFAGHVPEVLKTKYPDAKINSLGDWGGFEKKYLSYFLDPLDTLFNVIQSAFLKEQTDLFGTDHIYGADPFNEVTPPSWEPDYLATVSKSIYHSMKAVDPAAQWLQMSWIFYFHRNDWTNQRIEAFLNAVPQGKMMLLDYFCENTEVWKMTDRFYGQDYIWCYLGNFGGNTFLAGNLKEVEARMENAFRNGGDNLNGIGSTLEGFDSNPMMYEFVFEKAWSDGPTNVEQWIDDWAVRRLGRRDENAVQAWRILLEKIYTEPAALGQGPLTNARPSLTGHGNWTTNPDYKYDNKDLLEAWQLLIRAAAAGSSEVYRFDLTAVSNQVLGNYFQYLRNKFTDCYHQKDVKGVKAYGRQMLALLNDMNTLLASNHSFLFGKWLEDAGIMGVNEQESKYYKENARKIVTTWGTKGQSLNDYANRSWAGLTNDYYRPRWKMFIDDISLALKKDIPFDVNAFNEKVTEFEWNWTKDDKPVSSVPSKNSYALHKKLLKKYGEKIRSARMPFEDGRKTTN